MEAGQKAHRGSNLSKNSNSNNNNNKRYLKTHVVRFPFEPQLETSPCRGCCAAKIRRSCEKALKA